MFKEVYNHDGMLIEVSVPDGGQIVRINGFRFSFDVFELFANMAEEGTTFRFVKREEGQIILETVTNDKP